MPEESKAEEMVSISLAEWKDLYKSFRGAFDTPLARRRQDDEYANDARKRMRVLNEKITGEIY